MKYLILFLISLSAFAEYKVNIVNSEGQQMSKDGFDTEVKAQEYIEAAKSRWGKDERWERSTCDGVISTREIEDPMLGTVTEYRCPQTYTATIEDITAQRAQEALAKALDQNIECGAKVKKFITLRNIAKNIQPNQVTSLLDTYRIINELLDSGSLTTAEGVIAAEAVTALMTQEDKDAILAEIASCKAN